MVRTFRLDEFGYEVEIGKVALQADGAAWLKHGGTVVLATAVSAPSQEFPGFFPLTIDYREHFSAAGKIPGGYFKREGKATDGEVLTSRAIDRGVRPLFPVNYFDQVQVIATVYSYDKIHSPHVLGSIASSLALSLSPIPFLGPIGSVEVCRINGNWVINPSYTDGMNAEARLVVTGTDEGINMVEGSASEISESEFVDTLFFAHDAIKKLVAWQKMIQKELAIVKAEVKDTNLWDAWVAKADTHLHADRVEKVYIPDKVERNTYLSTLRTEFLEEYASSIEEEKIAKSFVTYIFDYVLKEKLTELICTVGSRVDGRPFDKVRTISTEVGILPFVHGSALFTRGRTQALVMTTLGGGDDEQNIETIMNTDGSACNFMLHYNFPPFSVGEVRWLRGPGRREIGHGHLAASALSRMLPSKDTFPYTIRVVADMLESDGSTSMATTCGSTMSLMQAGVPLKKMVSGIAMGLLKSKKGDFVVLSDISGFEDEFGLMDFKVCGSQDGITAIQMDIKYKGGLARKVFEVALEQSKIGRLHILNEMQKVMRVPNPNLSDLVPKYVTVKISTDKIGAVIGSGGKTIREITEKTKTTIDIEPDGSVQIFGGPEADLQGAVNWVKTLAGHIEAGARYKGKVRRIVEFGIFVELVPGQDGLVHVSSIAKDKQRTFAHDYKVDEELTVEVIDYDATTGRIRLRIVE